MTSNEASSLKRPTGITGLDDATRGGLPAQGGVLVVGDTGSGKTILALQILARAAEQGSGGVLVSFEESVPQLERDAASFRWGPALLASDRWQVIDARPPADAEVGGGFDLRGLEAVIGAYLDRLGGPWLILDGIDQLLRLQPEGHAAVNEIRRLNEWCEERGVTLVVTGKADDPRATRPQCLDGAEYLMSAVLSLSTELVGRRLNRRFRVAKYRGTAHAPDELPLVISDEGLQIPHCTQRPLTPAAASSERLETDIPRLDAVLGGGLLRGSMTLVSGAPGTAKTTLAASIAHAAAERGETVLYLSFDELADRIVRNAASVGLPLQQDIDRGHLHVEAREAWSALIEEHYIAIEALIDRLQPQWLVIDPVSALLKAASAEEAYIGTERILARARDRGITCVLTSLTGMGPDHAEATLSHTSTLADTWIALDYRVIGGERNRALSVVKSRGSAHSNQLRELLLTPEGIDLAETYEYGSEVLMGTARIQKEHQEAAERRRAARKRARRQRDLERQIDEARKRMQEAQSEAEQLADELEHERQDRSESERAAQAQREGVLHQRGLEFPQDGPDEHEEGSGE